MCFEKLNALDVSKHVEEKETGKVKLKYLSWAWAWAEVKKLYPDCSYEIKMFADEKGLMKPFIKDDCGYMVFTSVKIGEQTHEMWLPVMDGANRALTSERQAYEVKKYVWKNGKSSWDGTYETKYVEKCTMFDINKTIMRCLVKNLAMFGLGLYIYAGEDLPETQEDEPKPEETKEPEIDLPALKGRAEQMKAWIMSLTDGSVDESCFKKCKPLLEEMKKAGWKDEYALLNNAIKSKIKKGE